MSNNLKISLLIFLLIMAAAFFWFRGWQQKNNSLNQAKIEQEAAKNASEQTDEEFDTAELREEIAEEEENFNEKCVSGAWTKIADVQGNLVTLSGKLQKVYPEDDLEEELANIQFYLEGQTKTLLSGGDLINLNKFESREVEIRGVKDSDDKLAVAEIRCAGAETDKETIDARVEIMNWLSGNINSIAPQKAPYQKWTIDTADFVDEKNVYVEYYDTAEDDEKSNVAIDTSRKLLLEVMAKPGGVYQTKTLAYWEMGEEDYELKTGSDKFENAENSYMYIFDPDEKKWTRI